MTKNLFSVPIFFIVFRETLEAAIIVSVLLGLAEQIVHDDPGTASTLTKSTTDDATSKDGSNTGPIALLDPEDDLVHRRRLIRKLRIQVSYKTSISSDFLTSFFRFLQVQDLAFS